MNICLAAAINCKEVEGECTAEVPYLQKEPLDVQQSGHASQISFLASGLLAVIICLLSASRRSSRSVGKSRVALRQAVIYHHCRKRV